MNDSEAETVRQLYACETCGLVYARLEEPQTCRLCETALFVAVYPAPVDQ
ncbi:hypothetical protein Halru_0879 [Halovivax ruber XH-70]|uniref:Rubrerythrin-like domain-containing protein n=1 Tax=Halovivax ruber (strain DSM 18193 / JCM 13892 / XH-70) TaxID=797302 RepID=L0I9K3_HALRX|nr:hypothetical protein [Halovivax ruber]AGB15503.1 hypothetical protein Halru_0879 [Halovivax ruber XH-70]